MWPFVGGRTGLHVALVHAELTDALAWGCRMALASLQAERLMETVGCGHVKQL